MGHICVCMQFDSIRISSIVEKVFFFCLRSKTSGSNFDISFSLLLANIVWVCLHRASPSKHPNHIRIHSEHTTEPAKLWHCVVFPSHFRFQPQQQRRRLYDCRATPHASMSLFPWGNLLTINRWNDMPFLLVRAVYAFVAIHSSNKQFIQCNRSNRPPTTRGAPRFDENGCDRYFRYVFIHTFWLRYRYYAQEHSVQYHLPKWNTSTESLRRI